MAFKSLTGSGRFSLDSLVLFFFRKSHIINQRGVSAPPKTYVLVILSKLVITRKEIEKITGRYKMAEDKEKTVEEIKKEIVETVNKAVGNINNLDSKKEKADVTLAVLNDVIAG